MCLTCLFPELVIAAKNSNILSTSTSTKGLVFGALAILESIGITALLTISLAPLIELA